MMEKNTLKIDLEKLQSLAKERTVKTQNIEYDLETLVKKLNKGIIKLNPDYQRNHRWGNVESSKLIESLILNIPIPTVYLSQDIDVDEEVEEDVSRYSVIDGQQRLTAIKKFMNEKFALEGLEVLKPLNGLHYNELPPFLVRRLEERTIKCLRIDSTVDSQVKYDIFERLNSGAVKLESQELRNAIYRGKFNDMIKELAKYENFRKLLHINMKDSEADNKVKKMLDIEYVLRFFAFYDGEINNMKNSFKDFLSEQMAKYNKCSDKELKLMEKQFITVVDLVYEKFGENAFSKYVYENKQFRLQSNFNASDFLNDFDERWNEVELLIHMAEQMEDEEFKHQVLCRTTIVLIVANFEGFLNEIIRCLIKDINANQFFRFTSSRMKKTYCTQFFGDERGNEKKITKLIGKFDELDALYDIEPFLYENNKNPKASVIEKLFNEISNKEFFAYLTECDLEEVFENEMSVTNGYVNKLKNAALSGTDNFPYQLELDGLGFNLDKKKAPADCLWKLFMNETLKARHTVAHGISQDNTMSLLEIKKTKEKIKILELSFAILILQNSIEVHNPS